MHTGQAADFVIIRSNAVDWPKGRLLDSNTTVNLPVQTEITAVFTTGGTQTITGPFQGKLSDPLGDNPADENLIVTLADFVNQEKMAQRILRSATTTPQNIWLVDISTTKRFYCVAPSGQVTLWRPEDQGQSAGTLRIKHKSSGKRVQNTWPARQSTLIWPSGLPIIYGDTYTVALETRQQRSSFKKLVLYQLPNNLPTDSHKVVWMVAKGCIPQANMLLASLR
jgi:hypothetical protein